MTITEATRQALAEGKSITRREWCQGWPQIIVTPERLPDCCTIWMEDVMRHPEARWSPSAEDLTAEDWEVIEARHDP